MIQREQITVTGAAGGAGVATATAATVCPIAGVIYSVYLSYTGSPPVGTTVTIEGVNTPKQAVLAVTGNTSKWFHCMHQAVSSADGTSSITNQGQLVVVFDRLQATIASANDDDGVVVTLLYEVVK